MKKILSILCITLLGLFLYFFAPPKSEILNFENKTLAFLGDSLTMGKYMEDNPKQRFSSVLCAQLNANELNCGISGTTIAYNEGTPSLPQWPSLFDNCFVKRFNQIEKSTDYIFVFGDTNDYIFSTPLSSPNSTQITDFYGALKILIYNLKLQYPNSQLYFILPNPFYYQCSCTTPNEVGCSLSDYINAISSVCSDNAISTIPLSQILDFNLDQSEKDRLKYSFDGLHYNSCGSSHVATAIKNYLEKTR